MKLHKSKQLAALATASVIVTACGSSVSSSSSPPSPQNILKLEAEAPAPEPEATSEQYVFAKLEARQVLERKSKKPKTGPPCNDRVVKWIWEAGFRGEEVRVAWAIAQRESNGQPRESTWPDLGIMQLNAPSWQGSKYWPANIYDPVQSFKAVKKMVRDMNWQPWGLRVKNGQVSYDFSSYGGWSSWQHQNWIIAPFEKYYSQYPNKCRD